MSEEHPPEAAPPDPAARSTTPDPPAGPAATSRRRRVVALASLLGLALMAFATGLLLFNNLVMPRLIHGSRATRVPDLANLTLEQAERTLRPMGLQLSRTGEPSSVNATSTSYLV